MNLQIRAATSRDRDDIRDVCLRAFPEGERQPIAALAANLLGEDSDPATINLVAEAGGEAVGYIAFSPVYAGLDNRWVGYILAPLAVKPKHHHIGIGSNLVKSGIALLSEKGVNLLFVYGDPKYYCKFGFGAKEASNFVPPYELKYLFGWLAISRGQKSPDQQVIQLSCVASLRNPSLW